MTLRSAPVPAATTFKASRSPAEKDTLWVVDTTVVLVLAEVVPVVEPFLAGRYVVLDPELQRPFMSIKVQATGKMNSGVLVPVVSDPAM